MAAHLMAAAAGLVVMAAPSLFGYSGLPADIDHIIGPVATSVGIMAASQILRALRWLDVPLGLVLLGSMLVTTRTSMGSLLIALAGATLAATAFVRGKTNIEFGGGWSSLWKDHFSDGR